MFLERVRETARYRQLLLASQLQHTPQFAGDPLQPAVAGEFLHHTVKHVVLVKVTIDLAGRRRLFQLRVHAFEVTQLPGRAVLDRQARTQPFQRRHDRKQLVEAVTVQCLHIAAAAWNQLDQGLCVQHLKRLAQRGAADAQFFAQRLFVDPLTRPQGLRMDPLTQPVGHLQVKRLLVDCFTHRRPDSINVVLSLVENNS